MVLSPPSTLQSSVHCRLLHTTHQCCGATHIPLAAPHYLCSSTTFHSTFKLLRQVSIAPAAALLLHTHHSSDVALSLLDHHALWSKQHHTTHCKPADAHTPSLKHTHTHTYTPASRHALCTAHAAHRILQHTPQSSPHGPLLLLPHTTAALAVAPDIGPCARHRLIKLHVRLLLLLLPRRRAARAAACPPPWLP